MKTSPESATSSPAITRRSVDLPLPLGPSSAVSEPLATSTETSSSATNSPNRFVTLRASIATRVLPWSDDRHRDERDDGKAGEQHGGRVRVRLLKVLVRRLYVLGQRLRAALDAAGDDCDRTELAETPRGRQHDAVGDGVADRGQRDAPERDERGRAERGRRLLLLGADLAQHRHDLAHDERQRHERRREQDPRIREEDAVPM